MAKPLLVNLSKRIIKDIYYANVLRCCRPCVRLASRSTPVSEQSNEPIQYSSSKAAKWHAKHSFRATQDDSPSWEVYVIVGSVAVFLIYFCVLREENDVDIKLGKSLYDHIEGLEELQVKHAISHFKETGQDTKKLENRLAEIEEEKRKSLGLTREQV